MDIPLSEERSTLCRISAMVNWQTSAPVWPSIDFVIYILLQSTENIATKNSIILVIGKDKPLRSAHSPILTYLHLA